MFICEQDICYNRVHYNQVSLFILKTRLSQNYDFVFTNLQYNEAMLLQSHFYEYFCAMGKRENDPAGFLEFCYLRGGKKPVYLQWESQ